MHAHIHARAHRTPLPDIMVFHVLSVSAPPHSARWEFSFYKKYSSFHGGHLRHWALSFIHGRSNGNTSHQAEPSLACFLSGLFFQWKQVALPAEWRKPSWTPDEVNGFSSITLQMAKSPRNSQVCLSLKATVMPPCLLIYIFY